MPVAPTANAVSGGVTFPPLETGIQAVWPSPYHAGLARQRLRRLHCVPRFPAMLLSPRGFPSRSGGRPRGHLLPNLGPLRGRSSAELDGARFPGTGLSSDYTVEVAVGRPAWMLSWQEAQATRVLRFRFAMICTQAGFSLRPGLLRSASLRMWWTSNRSVVPQTSQRPARSRWISSFPLVVTREGERSASTAFVCRRSGMPPNRATSGRFPSRRSTVTWKHTRGPSGVSMVVLYLRAIFDTEEWCFPARVLSSEVCMTHRSLSSLQTSAASR